MNKRVYIETMMRTDDEGIRAVRDVRQRISAEFDNDPRKLVEHYMASRLHGQETCPSYRLTAKTSFTPYGPLDPTIFRNP